MVGDELSVELFLWGTAFAFGLAAVTMAGSGRTLIIRALWVAAVTFLSAALLWPFADKLPNLKAFVEGLSANHIALNILGILIFSLLVFDFRLRSKGNARYGEHLDTAREEAARRDIVQTMTSLARDSDKGLKAANDKITGLENNTIRNNQRILGYDRDFPLLMQTVLEQLALSLLSCIQEHPRFSQTLLELNPELAEAERKSAEDYCSEVNRILGSTQWGIYIRSIIGNSEGLGEHKLRSIPNDERPQNIDPLDLRRYMIAKVKCENLWAFVQSQRHEAADRYLSHLNFLKQRQHEREYANNAPH